MDLGLYVEGVAFMVKDERDGDNTLEVSKGSQVESSSANFT